MGNQVPGAENLAQCCQSSADGENAEVKSTDEWGPSMAGRGNLEEDSSPVTVVTAVSSGKTTSSLGQSPTIFSLSLTKSQPSESLGLDLLHSSDGKFLVVERIQTSGVVFLWNQRQDLEGAPARKLREGDHIVKVNQVEADNQRMIQEFRSKETFNITVYRRVA